MSKETSLVFTATECGSKIEHGTVICGASNAKGKDEPHTFIFMRSTDVDGTDDDGPYFELDDQSQGSTQLVSKIIVSRRQLEICLKKGQRIVPYQQIRVVLSCPQGSVACFFKGLRRVYKGAPGVLQNRKRK